MKKLYQGGNLIGMDEIRRYKSEINELLEQKEMTWNQRSRVSWLKEGGYNVTFFHSKVSDRHRQNFIDGLGDNIGLWRRRWRTLKALLFNILKTSSNPQNSIETLEAVSNRVTPDINKALTQEFRVDEVYSTHFQMHPTKALGPDRKKGHMAFKLDMSKAYDRVEWCFLEQLMVRMGFHPR
ncbi:hypothetical protein F0562_017608 [Nyssa sinensis]|uniref:Reverse transcriptase domain-containing protein n=1 Tax=Nyssa sinensis TaxID=561372 RepID=A0A5J4ZFI7_9ASTE|nr:hypothetical protein F0562_017608 [Nyssa sinensis]